MTYGGRGGPIVGGYFFQNQRTDTGMPSTVNTCKTEMGRVAALLRCEATLDTLQVCLDLGSNTIVRGQDGASIQINLALSAIGSGIDFGPISVTPL